eukprot:m.43155 g.43155  ORF g.43155 m.43155 type:complete len:387 (-) comp19309_c1_seq1:28-1188(-)
MSNHHRPHVRTPASLSTLRAISIAVLAIGIAPCVATSHPSRQLGYPSCATGLTCTAITLLDDPTLTFDCAHVVGGGGGHGGLVYHMHGNDGALSKGMFFNLMLQLAPLGFTSLACDQRGYSPGASPHVYGDYNYNKLAQDILSVIDASGLLTDPATNGNATSKFHIVSHDQGARVSWHAIAKDLVRQRLLSFTSLSIPHSDVFSDSLYGPLADFDQQTASQYVRELVLPNSTTVYHDAIYKNLCLFDKWFTTAACQNVLWWYNGAIDAGAMALAPMMPYGSIAKRLGIPESVVGNLTQYALSGVAQTVKVGNVTEFPVLYACGANDSSDLCKQIFGDESGKLISKYTYLRLDSCGHDVLGCSDTNDREKLEQAIIANIQSASPSLQ